MYVSLIEVASPFSHVTRYAGMIAAGDFTGVAQGDLIVFHLLSKKRSESYKTSDNDDIGLAASHPLFSVNCS